MPSTLQSHLDLPLIDISQFPSDFGCEGLNYLKNHPGLAAVKGACIERGFFTVVNHGIPEDIFEDVESVIHELCAMPAEAKQRAVTSNPLRSYTCTPRAEGFSISESKEPNSNTVRDLSRKIWPEEGNRRFCETIETYTLYLEDVARKISKIIIASLGLHVDRFYHSDFNKCTSSLRVNHYYCNGKSMEEEILLPHTDINCFTILYQDNKGGLQIRSKEGEWLNAKPHPHSLVVNLGDSLKAWSNGRYRSAEHRAVCKGSADRYSVPYFVAFPDEKQVWAPAELVDDKNPRRYRPFMFSQLKHDYINSSDFKEKNLLTFFERYAGV